MESNELEVKAEQIYDCEQSAFNHVGWLALSEAQRDTYREKAKLEGQCLFDGGSGKYCPLCGMLRG